MESETYEIMTDRQTDQPTNQPTDGHEGSFTIRLNKGKCLMLATGVTEGRRRDKGEKRDGA